MINFGIETVTSALHIIKSGVEKLDGEATTCPHYYGNNKPADIATIATKAS
jgi:hypothetical protein